MDDIFPFPTGTPPHDFNRELAVTLLKEIQPKLKQDYFKRGCSPFICDRLHHLAINPRHTATVTALTHWIDNMLGGLLGGGLGDWLHKRGALHYVTTAYLLQSDFQKLQRTRVAWVDWMIKELEK